MSIKSLRAKYKALPPINKLVWKKVKDKEWKAAFTDHLGDVLTAVIVRNGPNFYVVFELQDPYSYKISPKNHSTFEDAEKEVQDLIKKYYQQREREG